MSDKRVEFSREGKRSNFTITIRPAPFLAKMGLTVPGARLQDKRARNDDGSDSEGDSDGAGGERGAGGARGKRVHDDLWIKPEGGDDDEDEVSMEELRREIETRARDLKRDLTAAGAAEEGARAKPDDGSDDDEGRAAGGGDGDGSVAVRFRARDKRASSSAAGAAGAPARGLTASSTTGGAQPSTARKDASAPARPAAAASSSGQARARASGPALLSFDNDDD